MSLETRLLRQGRKGEVYNAIGKEKRERFRMSGGELVFQGGACKEKKVERNGDLRRNTIHNLPLKLRENEAEANYPNRTVKMVCLRIHATYVHTVRSI